MNLQKTLLSLFIVGSTLTIIESGYDAMAVSPGAVVNDPVMEVSDEEAISVPPPSPQVLPSPYEPVASDALSLVGQPREMPPLTSLCIATHAHRCNRQDPSSLLGAHAIVIPHQIQSDRQSLLSSIWSNFKRWWINITTSSS